MLHHTGEKPHECEVCKKRFADKKHLTVHRVVHTGERNYKCKLCPKDYKQFADLSRHIKREHPEEKK